MVISYMLYKQSNTNFVAARTEQVRGISNMIAVIKKQGMCYISHRNITNTGA